MGYDFTLSEEHQLLQQEAVRAVREFVRFDDMRRVEDEGLEPTLSTWQALAGLGYACLCGPEPEGLGGSILSLCLLATELGRRGAVLPVVHHNAALMRLAAVGAPDLARFCSGERVLTIAHFEADDQLDADSVTTTWRRVGDGIELAGVKYFVPFATIATDFLVTATDGNGGLATALVPRESVRMREYHSTGKAGRAIVTIDCRLPASALIGEEDGRGARRMLDDLRIALCALISGAVSEAVEMTAGYVKDRIVFGRPLGSFQAVQHRAADMLADSEAGRLLTLEAAWRRTEGLDDRGAADTACAYVAEGAQRVIAHAHQLHGAIGITYEYNLPLLSTLVKDYVADLGRPDLLREAVAAAVGP